MRFAALAIAAVLASSAANAQVAFEPVTLDEQTFVSLYNHANGMPTVHGRPIVNLLEELERKALAAKAERDKEAPKDPLKK